MTQIQTPFRADHQKKLDNWSMCLSENSTKFASSSQGAGATSRFDVFVMKTVGMPGVHKAILWIYVYTIYILVHVQLQP